MTRGSQIKPHFLQKLESYYIAGGVTLNQLSRSSGVGLSTLKRYASAQNWFARKQARVVLIQAETTSRFSRQLLEQVHGLQKTAKHCLPMKADQHYKLLIRLLELDVKLKSRKPQEKKPPQRRHDNIVRLRTKQLPYTGRQI